MIDSEEIKIIRISNPDDPFLKKLKDSYITHFPENERRDFDLLVKLLNEDSYFTAYAITYKDNYVGFLNCWMLEKHIYIEHFALEKTVQGKGLGTQSLKKFIANHSKQNFILEVEPPTDETKRRRISFYERIGFELLPFSYKQPPYHADFEPLDLKIMVLGDKEKVSILHSITEVYEKVYFLPKKLHALFLPSLTSDY